jgi:hypothetical protein
VSIERARIGLGLTMTEIVAVSEHPCGEVEITVYIVLALGFTTTESPEPVMILTPIDGLQE